MFRFPAHNRRQRLTLTMAGWTSTTTKARIRRGVSALDAATSFSAAATAAAVHFSLLASCKRHGRDPWAYLRDVLTRLPAMLPAASEEDLLALLPHHWHPA